MVSTTKRRFGALTALLLGLAILFVWAGAVGPDPADNNYPGTTELQDDTEAYIDQRVSVSGTVVETDPLTIEDDPIPGERLTVVLEGPDVGTDVRVGDELRVYGLLQRPEQTGTETASYRVDVRKSIRVQPWEKQYMYLVSFLGGLLVLGRLVNYWTVETTTWSIVPRTNPLHTKLNN